MLLLFSILLTSVSQYLRLALPCNRVDKLFNLILILAFEYKIDNLFPLIELLSTAAKQLIF
jgi:hypothetical protein